MLKVLKRKEGYIHTAKGLRKKEIIGEAASSPCGGWWP